MVKGRVMIRVRVMVKVRVMIRIRTCALHGCFAWLRTIIRPP